MRNGTRMDRGRWKGAIERQMISVVAVLAEDRSCNCKKMNTASNFFSKGTGAVCGSGSYSGAKA